MEGRYLISLPNKTERKLRKTLWWAELDLNQRCQKDQIYSLARYQLRSTDPYDEERLIYTGLSCSFSPEPVVFSITRGPSPYVHNLRVYSISEETQSELRGATPNFWPQLYMLIEGLRSTPGIYYQFSRRNDYLQLSPTIQNCLSK